MTHVERVLCCLFSVLLLLVLTWCFFFLCPPQDGQNALMKAKPHARGVQLLIEAGADKEAKDRVRHT